MRRFFLSLAGLMVLAASMGGCVSDQPEDPNRVNTIPWNRPQRWESQGPLGGMMPGSQ